jgi:nucleoside-diphosphate-sugar epimerase
VPVKVLLTGPGKLGRPLAARLAAAGLAGRVLARRPRPEDLPPGWEAAAGDVTRPETLAAPLAGVGAVLHLAGVTHSADPELYDRTNRGGTANLLAAAAAAGVRRFVHVSTRAIDPAGGAYSRSKAAAEALVAASPLAWTILRPAEVYGAGGSEGIDRLIAAVAGGLLVPVVAAGAARVAPLHVDDAVEGMAQALLRDGAIGRTYTLAGPEEMTYGELVARLARHLGVRRLQVPVPLPLLAAVAAAMRRLGLTPPIVPDQIPRLLVAKGADIGPAQADLGFAPRPLEAGLARRGAGP